jgi:hypothetical protein
MDRHDELTDGDETGSQAEGRVTQQPPKAPVPNARTTPPREPPRPLGRRILAALIPCLTVPGMCLGIGSIFFQILTVHEAYKSAKPLSVVIARPGTGEVFLITLPMAVSAIPLGLLGYWLARRETARIEKELVYPRGRPVTLQSRLWALFGVATGVLGLILRAVIQTLI